MTNAIVVQLRGGLGNQLFMYAVGRFLAWTHNVPLWLDVSYFNPKYDRLRKLEVTAFKITYDRIVDRDECFDIAGVMRECGIATFADDSQARFSPEQLLSLGPSVVLSGEWAARNQYLFNEPFRNVVISELELNSSSTVDFSAAEQMIKNASNSVAVQVRRGEYKSLQHIFLLLDDVYYGKAFAAIERSVSNPTYFVFSDEIDDVREHMAFPRPVTHVATLAPPEALLLAKACRHFVAANSTFSWWSAFLGAFERKLVIFPKHYYSDPRLQALHDRDTEYLGKGWIKL